MRKLCVAILLAGVAFAQKPPKVHAPDADDEKEKKAAPTARVAPNDAVITIKGLCPEGKQVSKTGAAGSDCQVIVTRSQFEQLVKAVQPTMDKQSQQHLATSYPQFLAMAQEAEKRGLDKSPEFAERVRFARLQILSQELVRQIQDEAAKVPEKDIEQYYQDHSAEYEQAAIERIVVPNRKEEKPGTPDSAGSGGEAEMTKEADALRVRAAAGESFAKLQKEAYEFAGVGGNTDPNPSMGKLRRRGLPIAHASVFDLKAGEVSPLISDATGHYIYKIDSKEIQDLADVKPEITSILKRQRMQAMIQSIQQRVTTDVNRAYFGAPAKDDDD